MQQNRIKDNFLPDDMFRRLTDFVDGKVPCRPNVDWFYNDTSVSYGDGCPQFTNMSYVNGKPLSNVYDIIDSLVFPTLRPLAVLRVKLNMTPRRQLYRRELHYILILLVNQMNLVGISISQIIRCVFYI